MAEVQLNGLTYHYREWGTARGTATPLLLLHGFTGSSVSWEGIARRLERRSIAVDLIGHGRTDAPADPARYAMDRAAEDLALLIEQLGCGPVHLLGYSMGGRLALYLALAYPALTKSLILESASPGLDEPNDRAERRAADERRADSIDATDLTAFVDHWEGIPLFSSQSRLPGETRASLRGQRLSNRPVGLANSLRSMGTGAQPSLWPKLCDLRAPTLLIAGALDEKFRRLNEMMQQCILDARLRVVDDAGHTVHLEQPGEFAQIVNATIDRFDAMSR